MTVVLSVFGLLALLLAAVGLYGVIAYRVSARTQEIGVRMAIGAGRGAIFREVVWYAIAVAAIGIAIGEVAAVPATRLVASLQAGLRPGSLSTHIIVVAVWLIVTLVAACRPAGRAARIDPSDALRHE